MKTPRYVLLCPYGGCALQPNVAASATLGNGKGIILNRNAVASFTSRVNKAGATALRLKDSIVSFSQGSRPRRQPWAPSRSPVGAKRTNSHPSFHKVCSTPGSDKTIRSLRKPILINLLEDTVFRIDIDSNGSFVQFHFFDCLFTGWFQNDAPLAAARHDVER